MDVVREVYVDLHSRQLRADAYWLSTVANEHADRLSRDRYRTYWRLRRSVILVLQSRWGPFTVDRFATVVETQLERFNSVVANPGADAVDAYRQPWGGMEHSYVNSPLAQAALAISKMAKENASGVMFLPFWPAQPRWARIIPLASLAIYPPSVGPTLRARAVRSSRSLATLAKVRVLCRTQQDSDDGHL